MHFIVGVITQKGTVGEVDDLMEPFDENKVVEMYISETREEFIKYARNRYADYLSSDNYAKFLNGTLTDTYLMRIFPGMKEAVEGNDDELFEFVIKAEGYSKDNFDEKGNHLESSNPDGRYDYYTIGAGGEYLKLKNGKRVGVAKCSDINYRLSTREIKLRLRYWERTVDGKEFNDSPKDEIKWGPDKETLLREYRTKDAFCERNLSWHPSCYITPDGEWIEDHSVWHAFSDIGKETREFRKDFNELTKKYSDYYFTVVDCHI